MQLVEMRHQDSHRVIIDQGMRNDFENLSNKYEMIRKVLSLALGISPEIFELLHL